MIIPTTAQNIWMDAREEKNIPGSIMATIAGRWFRVDGLGDHLEFSLFLQESSCSLRVLEVCKEGWEPRDQHTYRST